MPFPPLGDSDLVVAYVSIDFPSNSKGNAMFMHIFFFLYSCATWDSLCDHFVFTNRINLLNLKSSSDRQPFRNDY